jgi:Family of unknown function (DUF5681)
MVGRPFEKGQSGNPGGRPKMPTEVRELARQHTRDAINYLADIMKDEEAAPAARVSAISILLDRAYGKAPQSLSAAIELPEIQTAADAAKACAALVHAVAAGIIAPAEATELGKLVDSYVRAVEANDLEARLSRLEEVRQ